jgi:hypothetical protein
MVALFLHGEQAPPSSTTQVIEVPALAGPLQRLHVGNIIDHLIRLADDGASLLKQN